ncbi:hypothetical protein E0L36_03690 [Streptomyces sp. AJS327]|nr:hypothetical protein [Streptomyces sp. AJS327]
MFLRRSAAALAASAVLSAAVAPVAHADGSPSPGKPSKLPEGLYGKSDPTFDGVWRQSLTLLAQEASGATPAKEAVDWLAGQQCDDGSFTAYRADPERPCDAEDQKKTPSDTNATALAVQALAAVGGRSDAVAKSVDWLTSVQNKDGGWGFNPGQPSDANSVAVVVGALTAAGEKPREVVKDGKDPYAALLSLQLGCDAKKPERGAFAYQPDKKTGDLAPNDYASTAAVLATLGKGLLTEPADGEGSSEPKPLACEDGEETGKRTPRTASSAGAAYLTGVLDANDGHLRSAMPGAEKQPDHVTTAYAVIALAAGGQRDEARTSLRWLEKSLPDWKKAKNDPGSIAAVMLATHATGGDAAELGDVALLKRLNATGPEPAAMPAAGSDDGDGDGDGGSSAVATWSLVGAGLAAGAGIGFLMSGRRKRQGL